MLKPNRYYIFLIMMIPVSVFAQVQHHQSKIEHQLKIMIQQEGNVIYSALYSLPETHQTFIEAVGENGWNSYMPKDLPSQLNSQQKTSLIREISKSLQLENNHLQHSYFRRLNNWIIAEKQLVLFQHLTSIEQTMAAIYHDTVQKKYFEPFLLKRGMNIHKTDSHLAATTLSSSEISEITYKTLNGLSVLNQHDLLIYFRDLYNRLLNDLSNW